MSDAPVVVAAIITYNRCADLRRLLEAIRAQSRSPDRVLVIDNASTDETPRMLASDFPEVWVHRTAENLGCAGGMHEALRLAMTATPDYIWFFDDDVVPAPTCLQALLDEIRLVERDQKVSYIRPMVQDPKTGDVAGGGLTHGALLRADVVREIGLPQADLFIELSDHHYNVRMRRAGFSLARLPKVLALHPVDRQQSLRVIAREGYRVKPWRLYYAVRNRVYYALHVDRSPAKVAVMISMIARTMILLTLFGRPRRGHTMILRGLADGVQARLGRRVAPGY